MKATSERGLHKMAPYRWAKRYRCRTRFVQRWRAHLVRATHRADRQAARDELRNYDTLADVDPLDFADDCDDM